MHLTELMRRSKKHEFKNRWLTGINCDKDSLIINILILVILSIKKPILQCYL